MKSSQQLGNGQANRQVRRSQNSSFAHFQNRHADRPANSRPGQRTPPHLAGWANWCEVRVKLRGMPSDLSIHDVHKFLNKEGNIVAIDLYPADNTGRVRFRPPPRRAFWEQKFYALDLKGKGNFHVPCELEPEWTQTQYASTVHTSRSYDERMELEATSLQFGHMLKPTEMMSKKSIEKGLISFGLNMRFEEVIIQFQMLVPDYQTRFSDGSKYRNRLEKLKISVPFRQMQTIKQVQDAGVLQLLIDLKVPPKVYREVTSTIPRDVKKRGWTENNSWYRQTDVGMDSQELKGTTLTLRKHDVFFDIGSWRTYCLTFKLSSVDRQRFDAIRQVLQDYNIDTLDFKDLTFTASREPTFWDVIDPPADASAREDLMELNERRGPLLPFDVQYQLEVCISRGILNEQNLTEKFAKKLIHMDKTSARELLEHVATQKDRIYDPMSIFNQSQVACLSNTRIPDYCALLRSIVVTPTTLQFNTPTVETSNRIIRQFSDHSDHFIRVRFTEEGSGEKIHATDKDTNDELFSRIKRTFANGITVGGRQYTFLAFGNSQFREHGAYFFAPLPNLSKGEIRAWMGSFEHIKHVALFASRLGQCFSTTRAIATQAELCEIADVDRNEFHFSDGVGKISPDLALIIADHLGISQKKQAPPSAFQFRLGGCKGVLAVWPDVRGKQIHIRETQYKFPAVHEGLEIIRYSQFASANLNRQIILVLSSLGVPDIVFKRKLESQLSDIEEAMTNSDKALEILQRDIDHNQITLKLAGMVLDGFQERKEPFITSLLRLWRAWSIKYLKEKARIIINEGTLLLGCLDETGILRGHFEGYPKLPPGTPMIRRLNNVPQIFVQLSKGPQGKPKIITGPMLLARNPSLHPGDIRVVCGVDVPKLYHLMDCVVLPQTGDRDVASMCSGGDLDGDDFEVIWDQDLLPSEWNHEPMDYSPPEKIKHDGVITDNDLTNFFINYMKNDTLPTIAHAHVAFADASVDGVKDRKCIELAGLHSEAVDFVKTGRPAIMTQELRPKLWPHFMNKKRRSSQIYHSDQVLGQLYDHVERVTFEPDFTAPFDERVIFAFELSEDMINDATQAKQEYDNHMHRIMAQHAIKSEFEVWSTFILEHNHSSDFKIQESMGEVSAALKDQFKEHCIRKAGGKDYDTLAPFVAAMYKVTADQVNSAIIECREDERGLKIDAMPLISFPWLFQGILGKIAKLNAFGPDQADQATDLKAETDVVRGIARVKTANTALRHSFDPNVEDDLKTAKGTTQRGKLLKLQFDETKDTVDGDVNEDKIDFAQEEKRGHEKNEQEEVHEDGLKELEDEEGEEEIEETIELDKQPISIHDRLASLGLPDDDD